MTQQIGTAIIGCGNIADPYAASLSAYPEIDFIGVTDLDLQRAEALAEKYDCGVYPSLDSLLADGTVELVVNLTIHHAHKDVTSQCLEAGKHVYSEKPLALSYAEAGQLVELAEQKGLRLGCSPFTYMGEAQQTAWKLIREGRLGTIRLAYAEVNWGRIESWHPAPGPFYQVGALWDVGVYPLTILTTMFGPARRAWAYGTILHPDRETKAGVPFQIETPDFVVAVVELESGLLIRLTTDFYVSRRSSKQDGIEFHGDLGTVYLSTWHDFDATVEFARFNEPFSPVPPVKEPYRGDHGGVEWGRAVREMAQAIAEGRPQRATGQQAAHVVEILEAISQAMERQTPVEIKSGFTPPTPMEWAM